MLINISTYVMRVERMEEILGDLLEFTLSKNAEAADKAATLVNACSDEELQEMYIAYAISLNIPAPRGEFNPEYARNNLVYLAIEDKRVYSPFSG